MKNKHIKRLRQKFTQIIHIHIQYTQIITKKHNMREGRPFKLTVYRMFRELYHL